MDNELRNNEEKDAAEKGEDTGREIDRYRADLPYPKAEGIEENPVYAAVVKSLYTGNISEITAIMQYFYYSCRLKGHFDPAYKAFKYIAVVEMEHMDLLAQVISALGGDPGYTYKTHAGESCWSAKNIRYSRSAKQILLESIIAEEDTIDAYLEACAIIKDEAVTCILHRIVMDERRHLEIFKELYKQTM